MNIVTEDNGSKWVSLDDYNFIKSNMNDYFNYLKFIYESDDSMSPMKFHMMNDWLDSIKKSIDEITRLDKERDDMWSKVEANL